VRSGDYFSQHICIRVQASVSLFLVVETSEQKSDQWCEVPGSRYEEGIHKKREEDVMQV
jgi:hypothetical protein